MKMLVIDLAVILEKSREIARMCVIPHLVAEA